jgi:hypothetical protein
MLNAHREAPREKKERVAEMIHGRNDLRGAEATLSDSKAGQNIAARAINKLSSYFAAQESEPWNYNDAKTEAHRMSEGDFVTTLSCLAVDPVLEAPAVKIKEYFVRKLTEQVHVLASNLAQLASKVEFDACRQRLRDDAVALGNKDRMASRAELLDDLRKVLVQSNPSK